MAGVVRALRVYFSARSARQPELQAFAAELRDLGLEVSSRWLFSQGADAHNAQRRRAAEEDLADLRSSDVCIAFTDGTAAMEDAPTASAGSGGRHVEFGYALAQSLKLVVVGPREHLFHELPGVVAVADWPSALRVLEQWAAESAPTD